VAGLARAIRTRSRSLRGHELARPLHREALYFPALAVVEEREGLFPQVGYACPSKSRTTTGTSTRFTFDWKVAGRSSCAWDCGGGAAAAQWRRLHFGGSAPACSLPVERHLPAAWSPPRTCGSPYTPLRSIRRCENWCRQDRRKRRRWSLVGFRLSEMVMLRIGHIHDSRRFYLRYSTAVSLLRIGNPSDIPTAAA